MLFLPFITLRKGLSNEAYSLFHSIAMMWNDGLFVLAVLVVAFSLVFPFAKRSLWKLNDHRRNPLPGARLHQ